MASEHKPIYPLPENFIEGGRIVNGLFKTRNFIEALILGGSVAFILWNLPIYPYVTVKIAVTLCAALPLFMLGVVGINGHSLFQFLTQFIKWRKDRGVILYNYNTNSRAVRPMRVMFAQELPKDKLVSKFDEYKENQRQKNSKQDFVEGKDFEFIEEEFSQSFLNTEKKLLGIKDEPKKKKRKKSKILLLTDGKKKKTSNKQSKSTKSKLSKVPKVQKKENITGKRKNVNSTKNANKTQKKQNNAVKLDEEIEIIEL